MGDFVRRWSEVIRSLPMHEQQLPSAPPEPRQFPAGTPPEVMARACQQPKPAQKVQIGPLDV